MGKRGPKPAPNALKILRGVRASRLNPGEPKPPPGTPAPPDYLDGAALDFWRENAPILAEMGLLTTADRHSFALLCDSFAAWRAQPTFASRRNEFRRLLSEFGLSPAGRAGLKIVPAEKPDALDKFIPPRRKPAD